MFWTDNPVADYERYDAEQAATESARDYILCDGCKQKIYREDDSFEGDDYYELDGLNFCEDCAQEWLTEQKIRFR